MLSWRVLFPVESRPGRWQLLWMRWVGASVGTLLPATQVGGDIVRARLAATTGVPVAICAASVVVDITVSVFAQILFTMTGLGLLAWVTGRSGLTGPAIVGSLVAIMAVGAFYAIQRFGLFRMVLGLVSHITRGGGWGSLTQHGATLDEAIRKLYALRRGVAASCVLTYTSWIAGSMEVWIALYAVGAHASFANAVILESVGQGVRAAMFFIPGAIGIQEGGYVVVGALLGIPAPIALALSLIRRVRELSFGVPGVLTWQVVESRRAWRKRPAESESIAPSTSTSS